MKFKELKKALLDDMIQYHIEAEEITDKNEIKKIYKELKEECAECEDVQDLLMFLDGQGFGYEDATDYLFRILVEK